MPWVSSKMEILAIFLVCRRPTLAQIQSDLWLEVGWVVKRKVKASIWCIGLVAGGWSYGGL